MTMDGTHPLNQGAADDIPWLKRQTRLTFARSGVVDPRYGVTSLVDLGLPVTMADVDIALRQAFSEVFGDIAARLPEATA